MAATELEDLEKTQELTVDPSVTSDVKDDADTIDLNPHDTQDLDANPVRTRFDSSQWITSW